MVPANVNDKYVIRFCVVAQNATEADIGTFFLISEFCYWYFFYTDYAWKVIREFSEELLESQAEKEQVRYKLDTIKM